MLNPDKSTSYEVIRYDPRLRPFILELQSNLWSSSVALISSHFDWKYHRNPYVTGPLNYVAMFNGKPVGMRGFFGTRWEGGKLTSQMTVLYADDMVIAPEHRGIGLMSKIMSSALRDLSVLGHVYTFSLSASSTTLHSSL